MAFTYDYPRPAFTLDIAVIRATSEEPEVLLIRRGTPPFEGLWALPGGFLDLDEELEAAARRELREETDIEVDGMHEIGVYGRIGRDPRHRTITLAYLALDLEGRFEAAAGDDAADAAWHDLQRPPRLAFDHRDILRDAHETIVDVAASTERLLPLLPRRFTLTDIARFQHALGVARSSSSLRRGIAARCRVAQQRRGRTTVYENPLYREFD